MGRRHHTRLEGTRLIGGLVTAGVLDEAVALKQLLEAAKGNTGDLIEAERSIRDRFEVGKANPLLS